MDTRTERIRALNDRLCTTGGGGNAAYITLVSAALNAVISRTQMAAVQCFDRFTGSPGTMIRMASTTAPC